MTGMIKSLCFRALRKQLKPDFKATNIQQVMLCLQKMIHIGLVSVTFDKFVMQTI